MKMFRHDMKHHLAELRFMAERKDFSEFRRYLNAMEEFLRSRVRLYRPEIWK